MFIYTCNIEINCRVACIINVRSKINTWNKDYNVTKQEFDTQLALGLFPRNTHLKFCAHCKNHTPQTYVLVLTYVHSKGYGVYKKWSCLVCNKVSFLEKTEIFNMPKISKRLKEF